MAYLVLWGLVSILSGGFGVLGIQEAGDVLLVITGTIYVFLVAVVWGVAFGLPAGAMAGLVGGFFGGLVALWFSLAQPGREAPIGYTRAAGLTAALANASVCLYVLPRVSSALGLIGPMSAENWLSVVMFPALVAAWAGWSARHRLSAWYRHEDLSEYPT